MKNMRGKYSLELKQTVLDLVNKGFKQVAIAKKLGIGEATISYWVHYYLVKGYLPGSKVKKILQNKEQKEVRTCIQCDKAKNIKEYASRIVNDKPAIHYICFQCERSHDAIPVKVARNSMAMKILTDYKVHRNTVVVAEHLHINTACVRAALRLFERGVEIIETGEIISPQDFKKYPKEINIKSVTSNTNSSLSDASLQASPLSNNMDETMRKIILYYQNLPGLKNAVLNILENITKCEETLATEKSKIHELLKLF